MLAMLLALCMIQCKSLPPCTTYTPICFTEKVLYRHVVTGLLTVEKPDMKRKPKEQQQEDYISHSMLNPKSATN